MTIFTDGLVQIPRRNLLDDVVTGQWDAAKTSAEYAWFHNPTTAIRRMNELANAEQGDIIQPAYPAYGVQEVRAEPATPLIDAKTARQQVAEAGLSLQIDDEGIRRGALDILMERKQAERQRQIVLDGAPGSTVPLQFLAGFGASIIDPINIASAFIPFVGQAKVASMLERAGASTAARFGARARIGAINGAGGAAVVEPLILAAAQQDQSDYSFRESLLNVAFGSILGGGLHGVGGRIHDLRRGSLLDDAPPTGSPTGSDAAKSFRTSLAEAIARGGDDDPMLALRSSLERGIEADRGEILRAAQVQAREEVLPDIRAQIEDRVGGRIPDVADVRAEIVQTKRQIDGLDATFREKAKEFQGQGMSRKQAESASRKAIADDRQQLESRQQELTDRLDTNKQSEIARQELGSLARGETPERYRPAIDQRAKEIADGFNLSGTARGVAEAAPWHIRDAALRAAIAQNVSGRDVDVNAIFDLSDPMKRQAALDQLKQPPSLKIDADGSSASARADVLSRGEDGTSLVDAQRMLDEEMALTDAAAKNAGIDATPYIRAADDIVADAETFAAAYRAAAICSLRN